MGPGSVIPLMGSRNKTPKAPAFRYLKPENAYFWTVSYQGSTPKISELPLQKISAILRNQFSYFLMPNNSADL